MWKVPIQNPNSFIGRICILWTTDMILIGKVAFFQGDFISLSDAISVRPVNAQTLLDFSRGLLRVNYTYEGDIDYISIPVKAIRGIGRISPILLKEVPDDDNSHIYQELIR